MSMNSFFKFKQIYKIRNKIKSLREINTDVNESIVDSKINKNDCSL